MHRLRFALVVAAAAALMTLVATAKGPGLSVDSVQYLVGGVNLADGKGIIGSDGTTITVFPPALSAVAAAGQALGGSPQTALRIMLVLCSAAIVVLGHLLLARLPIGRRMLLGSTLLIGLSSTVLAVTSMALSEAPFVVVTLASLLVLDRVVRQRRLDARTAIALCGLSWLGFLVRYTGVALIVTTVVACALTLRPWTRANIGRIVALGAASCAVPFLWVLRNLAADGTVLGPRYPSPDSPLAVPPRFVGTVGKWVIPLEHQLPRVVFGLVGVAWSALVGWGLLIAWRRTTTDRPARRSLTDGLMPAVVFTVLYSLQLGLSQITTALDVIGPRLLAPLFVPALMLSTVALSSLASHLAERPDGNRLLTVGTGALAALLALHIGVGLNDTVFGARDGIGFNGTTWTESPLARATVAARGETRAEGEPRIVTNNVAGMWAATGLVELDRAPSRNLQRGVPIDDALGIFAAEVACTARPTLLALYDDGHPSSHTADELGAVVQLSPVAITADGALYRVTPLDGAAAPDCPTG